MEILTPAFIVGVALTCVLASISIWAPRKIWVRASAVALVAAISVSGYLTLTEMLSRPKPMSLAWAERAVAEAEVLGSTFIEGEAIFVWLRLPDNPEPRAYRLPWNQQQAQQLQDAMNEATEEGTGVRMRMPFQEGVETEEPLFYALPQPPTPDKTYTATPNPIVYDQPGSTTAFK
jgi:hypothetical protein